MSRQTRRDHLKQLTATALAGLGGLPRRARAQASRPNIIFILSDNTQYDDLGCTGHPFIKTPGLDKLAGEGLIFDYAFNTTSLCSPARASILTGQYAHNHGVLNNHTPWPGGRTFFDDLKAAGYDNAFIGKWHMPGDGLPDMPALDQFISYTYHEGQGSYYDCPLIINGKETPPQKSYLTEELTDFAIDFVTRKRQAPFCLYLSHRAAHPPFIPPDDIRGMYDHVDFEMPPETDFWFSKTDQNVFQGIMMGDYKQQYLKYLEVLTAMDRQVARFLDALDTAGLRDNTVVIYTADNGMMWGEHHCQGIRRHWEESIRLPFIIRAPGLIPDPGGKRSQMILNLDLAPTFLELAGERPGARIDGTSLLPFLADPGRPGREDWLLEFFRYFPENTPSYTGVRTETHKYVEFEKSYSPQLYDLTTDPHENKNLYGTRAGQAATREMQARLARLKRET